MDVPTTVTYHFENGAKQICAINDKVIYNVKGRLRNRNELLDIFTTTAHDLGAIKFEL
jgi:hypothetical protein